MIKEIKKQTKYLGKEIHFLVTITDDGIQIMIAGGDKSHIGSVAVISPLGSCCVTTFPGHKETEIVKKWADTFYERFHQPLVVSAGIHYDGITKEQIKDIVKITDEKLEEFMELLE